MTIDRQLEPGATRGPLTREYAIRAMYQFADVMGAHFRSLGAGGPGCEPEVERAEQIAVDSISGMAGHDDAKAIREAAIDECAKVIAGFIKYGGSAEHGITINPYADASAIIRAIRNLSEPHGAASPTEGPKS